MRRGFFPTYLPDFIDQVIEYNPLLITYTGELHLTNGQLNQLVSVARTGNAVMSNEWGMLRISMAASLKQVAVSHWLHECINIRRVSSEKWLENSSFASFSDEICLLTMKHCEMANDDPTRASALIIWFPSFKTVAKASVPRTKTEMFAGFGKNKFNICDKTLSRLLSKISLYWFTRK